ETASAVKPGQKSRMAKAGSLAGAGERRYLGTGFWFITMINCKPFRRNRHGCCSFFLLQRVPRHRDVMLSMHRDPTSANNWCDGERIQQGTIAGCEGTR